MSVFTSYGRPRYDTALGRWMGVGPYYAMFPMEFAFDVVRNYSKPNDWILDPFAGRASSVYAAAALGRHGVGIEINPVGWLYGQVKLNPPTEADVMRRAEEINEEAKNLLSSVIEQEPEFFHWCYSPDVLRYLLVARERLNWQASSVDATLVVIILIYLHGKLGQSLSNQMRQSKAMHPDYSIEWWKEKNLKPPQIDPFVFLKRRIQWRYEKGVPNYKKSRVIWGDSTTELKNPENKLDKHKFSLLLTSPPYFDVTNYHYDQWIRLWMLGGENRPTWIGKGQWEKKFSGALAYKELLEGVFQDCTEYLTNDAVIYVRTDAREFTLQTTMDVLLKVFPKKHFHVMDKPINKPSQTALYGDKSKKPGEVDIVLMP